MVTSGSEQKLDPLGRREIAHLREIFRPERLRKDHDELVALAAAKKYRALARKTFPAAEVAEAPRHLESHKSAGKIVLTF